ncbi:MAG TPA: hypothetical protein VNN25_10380 [Thermoanaerobaculia bacterium]|nr:hypothetical protein [Thermoanaerobaculia bacterium]
MQRNFISVRIRRACCAVAITWCLTLGSHNALASDAPKVASGLDFVVGTWTGTSTCVGNRPACKNETVVYRFVPLDGHPNQVRLYADKIIDGKRVPMGALVFEVDEHRGTLRGEFTRGQTQGEWSFAVIGKTMTGKLVILPERSVGRDVKARRPTGAEVPAAPPVSDYDN